MDDAGQDGIEEYSYFDKRHVVRMPEAQSQVLLNGSIVFADTGEEECLCAALFSIIYMEDGSDDPDAALRAVYALALGADGMIEVLVERHDAPPEWQVHEARIGDGTLSLISRIDEASPTNPVRVIADPVIDAITRYRIEGIRSLGTEHFPTVSWSLSVREKQTAVLGRLQRRIEREIQHKEDALAKEQIELAQEELALVLGRGRRPH